MITNLKTCNKCLTTKPLTEFRLRKSYKHNNHTYYNQCKKCISAKHLEYRINNPDKVREHERKRSKDIPRRFAHAKYEATVKRSKIWSISLDEFADLMKKSCHYCQDKLHDKLSDSGCGLDRIDNSKGYELDNVLPCCKICNYIRTDILSVSEAEKLISLLLKLRGL